MSSGSEALGPGPSRSALASPTAGILASLAVVLAMIVWLRLVGRPFVCPCGVVKIWQGDLAAAENSQQFSDWYSLLHIVFGMALAGFVAWMKPRWPLGKRAVTAVVSSALWEGMENTPVLIAMFAHPEGAPAYAGDSILNATGDTVFVMAGFFLAARLPVWATLVIALAADGLVEFAVHDGFVLGTLRLLGAPV
ncbi:DUF2585 family protein [Aurantimonas sp. VKM B-3413]|uniref:DUF2585 family protein n=1 Tax=Aurantimonas sp. VKM B-3413 TaxID=2779401 RepID=UPI001E3F0D88|nr:DUF2585 family protein [Aurantimonas sp. VKM B-3413]MCB8838727.1 DUF2585 family protein [Aurantimonas sp. VKM B-3413]